MRMCALKMSGIYMYSDFTEHRAVPTLARDPLLHAISAWAGSIYILLSMQCFLEKIYWDSNVTALHTLLEYSYACVHPNSNAYYY
jgi:hypothetical protein